MFMHHDHFPLIVYLDGSDYDGTLQKVTFTPSDIFPIVSVPILNDGEEEGDENFRFFSEVDSSVRLNVNTIQAMGVVIISDNEGDCTN